MCQISALLAHALIDQTSDWRTIDTAEFLMTYSKHLLDCYLGTSSSSPYLGTSSSSPGFVSSSSAGAYPIAFCVAEFNSALSSRIWKRQNFFAICSCRLPMVWNLLNSNSRVCISSTSSCVRKSLRFLLLPRGNHFCAVVTVHVHV